MSKIVVLDPGHGGKDAGCVNGKLYEKDIVLKLSKMMKPILEKQGVTVFCTRETDVFVELSDRATFANNKKADLFFSIHVNAGGGTGFESFVYTKASQNSIKLQKAVNKKAIQVAKSYGLGTHGEDKKAANLAVVRLTNMPAMLSEIGFIDNSKDLSLIQNELFLYAMAESYCEGILSYLGITKTKTSTPSAPQTPQKTASNDSIYRVFIDNKQIGAYSDKKNILEAIEKELAKNPGTVRIEKK